MMLKNSLLSPGPVPIPPESLLQLAKPIILHRSEEFSKIYTQTINLIKQIYETKEDILPVFSSGTGALETAICNTLSSNDSVLIINNGLFSNRWGKICLAYGLNVIYFDIPYGKDIDLSHFKMKIKTHSKVKAVLIIHSETSTGALLNLKEITSIIQEYSNALILVDSITSVLVHPLDIDKLNLDVVISSSQKSYMSNPGVCFLSFSKKAWKHYEQSNLPKFYFDLMKEKKSQEDSKLSSWTPPINTFFSLLHNLKWITSFKLNFWFNHYKMMAESTRKAIQSLNLKIFPENPSNSVSVVELPKSINNQEFFSIMKNKYKMIIASQHKQLNLSIRFFRIGHIGYYDQGDLMKFFHALELCLTELGHKVNLGSSFRAIQEYYQSHEENKHLNY